MPHASTPDPPPAVSAEHICRLGRDIRKRPLTVEQLGGLGGRSMTQLDVWKKKVAMGEKTSVVELHSAVA